MSKTFHTFGKEEHLKHKYSPQPLSQIITNSNSIWASHHLTQCKDTIPSYKQELSFELVTINFK